MSASAIDLVAKPRGEWREEDGEVLWWLWPVREAPYVGSPLYNDLYFPYTHWTRIPVPTSVREDIAGETSLLTLLAE